MTGSVQELGSGLGVQRSKGIEPAGQGYGATAPLVRREGIPPASHSLLPFSGFTYRRCLNVSTSNR